MEDTSTAPTAPPASLQGRNSPSSRVCYLDEVMAEAATAVQEQTPTEPDGAGSQQNHDDSDSTPRSELPLADTPSLNGPPPSESVDPTADAPDGYFAPKPLRYQPALLAIPADEHTSLGTGHSPLERKITHSASPAPAESVPLTVELRRPSVQRDVSSRSNASTASTVTVRASEILPQPPTVQQPPASRAPREGPRFPDQAYSALQSQHHPTPYAPRILRSRSSNPSPFLSYHHHNVMLAESPEDPRAAPESGSRTAGNSPASSPGLFTSTSPLRSDFAEPELQGTYSSPYLHHTQRQVPKETHLAEVDVDPISGRKIINHYEIVDELGRGVHGKVKLGRNLKNSQYVAIKIVERYSKRKRLGKSSNHEAKIKREIAILKKARHPNIVGLLEVIDDPAWKKVYIVLEHVEMGEVKWRTEGAKEICLLEYRRCLREEHGVFEDEAAQVQDAHILLEAHRRIDISDRREWREWRRSRQDRSEYAGPSYWSHEYGGEADNDENPEDRASQTSTATGRSGERRPLETPTALVEPADPVLETCIHDDQRRQHEYLDQQRAHQSDDQEADFFDTTGLDGTMYGAYALDPPQDRTPSIAGSATSLNRLEGEEDQVPEHFRYVPLMTLSGARSAFRDTVLGLEFLHYQGVIHRDIKPANLLQSRDHHIKISDFGVSYLGRQHSADEDQSESDVPDVDEAVELAKTVGTPAFYAPELCRTDCDEDNVWPVSGQIDIWALGVTLYCLIFGRVPFHDNNTFALMRRIADEDVYIPRQRLKAVDESAGSRPSSRGRVFKSMNSNKRLLHDLDYEPVDDDLHDLLKRLLTKDPRKRIKLTEVKHHPWVLRDIGDQSRWLEETDPSHQAEGRKIEVSKEDVDVAVVPLNLVERVRSIANKVGGALRGAIGASRQSSRRRARSSTAGGESQPASNASSSSTISQDARRQEQRRSSLKPEESIFSALRASRDEHPLSHSVTASPEADSRGQFFFGPSSRPHSPAQQSEVSDGGRESRSTQPSAMDSSTKSFRTIRQSDIAQINTTSGAATLPALPSTPLVLDPPSSGSITNIFKGATEKIARTVRSRERKSASKNSHERAISIDSRSEDAHSEPSIGLSQMVAAGHVAAPLPLMEGSAASGSSAASPVSSRADSIASPEHLRPSRRTPSEASNISRQSSLASVTSHGHHLSIPSGVSAEQSLGLQYPQNPYLPLLGPVDSTEGRYSRANPVTSSAADVRFMRAQDELVRRRQLEEEMKRDEPIRPTSSLSQRRPISIASHGACPPSPDDDLFLKKQQEEASRRLHTALAPPLEQLPTAHIPDDPHYTPGHDFPAMISSSSDERFTSGMSQSTSNPSIPSVMSADSSILAEHQPDIYEEEEGGSVLGRDKQKQPQLHHGYDPVNFSFESSGTEVPARSTQPDQTDPSFYDNYEDGYQGDGDQRGDNAVGSDSDSDESFIEMTRLKSHTQGLTRSESVSLSALEDPHGNGAESAQHSEGAAMPAVTVKRSGTVGHGGIKSDRSGSGGTLTRVRRASHGELQ